jgi:hypothetical protein
MESKKHLLPLIEKWNEAKQKVLKWEKVVQECRTQLLQEMDTTSELKIGGYRVEKKSYFRSTITKANVPHDIWTQYAQPTKVETLTLTSSIK